MANEILASEHFASSRQSALKSGLKKYFNGLPCPNGHVCLRDIKQGCVECARDRWRKQWKSYRERFPDKVKEKDRKYSAENKIKISEKNAAWRAANENYASASKNWREANPERAKALVLSWQARNKDKVRIHKQNRRARLLENGGKLSRDVVQKLIVSQKGKCACCGKPLGKDYHVDHIMPLALGGTNTDDNVQLLTQRCNNQKRDKHPVDFMQQRGFLL